MNAPEIRLEQENLGDTPLILDKNVPIIRPPLAGVRVLEGMGA